MQRNIYDETKYIPLWLKSLCSDEFLYPTPLETTLICSKSFTMKPAAALDCIDDAHIACFGRLAAGHFARPRANATVLLEGLRVTS